MVVDLRKCQDTTRPHTIWPEEWPRLPKKQQWEQIANWDEEKTRLQEPRRKDEILRGLTRR